MQPVLVTDRDGLSGRDLYLACGTDQIGRVGTEMLVDQGRAGQPEPAVETAVALVFEPDAIG